MPNRNKPGTGRSRRGFAAMTPELRREIARRGGEASHQSGHGHEFTSEEAREAGRRGGEARWGRHRGEDSGDQAETARSGGEPRWEDDEDENRRES